MPGYPVYIESPVRIQELEKPPKNVCAVCEKESADLKCCSKCRTVPYCSRECQAHDWLIHKPVCFKYIQSNIARSTTTVLGEKGRKGKKVRTRGEIIGDLSRYAAKHNGDSFTFACWHAMNLLRDINKAKTHFLGVVLRRQLDATSDRTLYTLVDAEILPFQIMEDKFKYAAQLTPSGQELPGFTPLNMLQQDAESRKQVGGLGSVMVISTEFDEKAPPKSVQQYMADTAAPTFQPLGLFNVHRDAMNRMGFLFGPNWKLCLRNALNGGVYSPIFRPHPGDPE
ncbi:hypothetical protein FB451DRAFT_1358647 [Mycena latifolia]|nr:hypothetical protein FB451DRAFT_1358647 [Mycena latifolia]